MDLQATSTALPPEVLNRDDMRDAIRRQDFGRVFSLARKWGGISYLRIADACDMKPTRVGELARGHGQITTLAKIVLIADALRIPGAWLGLADRPWETKLPSPRIDMLRLPDEEPWQPLAFPTGGHRIGHHETATLLERVHRLRLADDVVYGKDLIGPALRELRTAVALYQQSTHTQQVGRELLSAIGELAQTCGWIASDAGCYDQAEEIYRLGMSAAKEAGDDVLGGNVAGSLAYQWSNTGKINEAVQLARAAVEQTGTHAPAKARALAFDRLAWVCTRAGDEQAAVTALGQAEQALAQASPGEAEPAYLYWVSATELQIMEARVYTELHRPLRAVPLLMEVLSHYDASHARELALYLSWLVMAYADANEPAAAVEAANRMLALGQGGSERTAERTRLVLQRLRAYRDLPEIAEILGG